MGRILLVALLALALVGYQKPGDKYDPDKLPPEERFCGRLEHQRNTPCKCMEHRAKERSRLIEECKLKDTSRERLECYASIPRCVPVTDEGGRSGDDGVYMPPQCSRSCKLARCECCKS